MKVAKYIDFTGRLNKKIIIFQATVLQFGDFLRDGSLEQLQNFSTCGKYIICVVMCINYNF